MALAVEGDSQHMGWRAMDVQDAERNAGLAQFVLEMDELPREYVEAIDVLRKVARAFPKMLEALERCVHEAVSEDHEPREALLHVRDVSRDALRAAREAVKP